MIAVRPRLKPITLVLATVASASVLSACSSSDAGGSDAGASESEQALLAFAGCMRDNGVPTFPDPVARPDGSFGFERPRDVSPEALQDALESCESEAQAAGVPLSPGSAEDPETQDAVLGFARCMRENGVGEFPDPGPGAQFHELFAGIDPNAPRVARAIQSCQSFLGQIFGHGG